MQGEALSKSNEGNLVKINTANPNDRRQSAPNREVEELKEKMSQLQRMRQASVVIDRNQMQQIISYDFKSGEKVHKITPPVQASCQAEQSSSQNQKAKEIEEKPEKITGDFAEVK